MAENKTVPTGASVQRFLDAVPDDRKRRDSYQLLDLMREVTSQEGQMWGTAIVGFGSYHYKYDSGREGDMPMVGFSPRKQNLTLYIMPGFERYEELLQSLGKHKIGKSCLYINRLADVDLQVLEQLVRASYEHMQKSSS